MVSFWPFKGGDNSAESFEKILSQLSTKINKTGGQQDTLRQKQRRYKALWTLYTTFAYILVAAILTLVTGWETWGYVEYAAVAGSPVLIFSVRTLLNTYYNYRIANNQNYLNELNKQRDAAIEKLKAATKYNSTQQLLEKYGGSPPQKVQASPPSKGKRKSEGGGEGKPNSPIPGRTGFAPPPTANIPSRQPLPTTPQSAPGPPNVLQASPAQVGAPPGNQSPAGEEFAPNAFAPPVLRNPSTTYATNEPKWYDRILDVVLGEDETSAKNRIALICQSCRLVNGQAPPGARTLEDVGKWRCSACHAMNGVESTEKSMLQRISAETPITPITPATADSGPERKGVSDEDAEEDEDSDEDEGGSSSPIDAPPASSTRSKARQRVKS